MIKTLTLLAVVALGNIIIFILNWEKLILNRKHLIWFSVSSQPQQPPPPQGGQGGVQGGFNGGLCGGIILRQKI